MRECEMGKLYKNNKIIFLFYTLVLTCFISTALGLKLGEVKIDTKVYTNTISQWLAKYKASFNGDATNNFLIVLILGVVIFLVSRRIYSMRVRKCSLISAICFSGLLLIGRAFYKNNTWQVITKSRFTLSKAVIIYIGYVILIYYTLNAIMEYLLPKIASSNWIRQYTPKRIKVTMKSCFVAIVLAWIPYIFMTYPCNFTPDAREEVAQFIGDEENSKLFSTVRYPEGSNTLINNHHPVAYTILVGATAKMGMMLGNINSAMFIFTLVQMFILIIIYSYMIQYIKYLGVPIIFQLIALGFIMFVPMIPMYALTVTKDSIYGGFMILTTIGVMKIILEEEKVFSSTKEKWKIAGSFLGLMLFRNNGLYISIIIVIIFCIRYRKSIPKLKSIVFMIGVPVVLYWGGIMKIVFPLAGIADGSPREIFSIPFQQVARYAKEWGEGGFEDGEIDTLNKILCFDKDINILAERYDPVLADGVKNHFNKDYTKAELKEFMFVWARLIVRHPGTCISATLNNNLYYYSIDYAKHIMYNGIPKSKRYYGLTNPSFTSRIRNGVINIFKMLAKSSMLGWCFSVGTWTYVYAMCIIFMIYKKCYRYVLMTLLVILNFLIGLAGPVAYMRYAVEWIVVLPLFGAMVWLCLNEKYLYRTKERE